MSAASGRLFVVVGPSGAGKDSLIDYARSHFGESNQVRFVTRIITRPADSGGEEHDAISVDEFIELERQGGFGVSWQAHGLYYGILASVRDFVADGGIAVVNGSRHAMPQIASAFSKLTVVSINAKPEILAERLRQRMRESADDIEKRLSRSEPDFSSFGEMVSIDNSGDLSVAGDQLVSIISRARLTSVNSTSSKQNLTTENSFERFMNGSAPFI